MTTPNKDKCKECEVYCQFAQQKQNRTVAWIQTVVVSAVGLLLVITIWIFISTEIPPTWFKGIVDENKAVNKKQSEQLREINNLIDSIEKKLKDGRDDE